MNIIFVRGFNFHLPLVFRRQCSEHKIAPNRRFGVVLNWMHFEVRWNGIYAFWIRQFSTTVIFAVVSSLFIMMCMLHSGCLQTINISHCMYHIYALSGYLPSYVHPNWILQLFFFCREIYRKIEWVSHIEYSRISSASVSHHFQLRAPLHFISSQQLYIQWISARWVFIPWLCK